MDGFCADADTGETIVGTGYEDSPEELIERMQRLCETEHGEGECFAGIPKLANLPIISAEVVWAPGGLQPGKLLEGTLKAANGMRVGALAEVSVQGGRVIVSDLAVYPVGAEVANAVGVKDILKFRNALVELAKAQGFKELAIRGMRVLNSTSANPGKVIDILIDLTK